MARCSPLQSPAHSSLRPIEKRSTQSESHQLITDVKEATRWVVSLGEFAFLLMYSSTRECGGCAVLRVLCPSEAASASRVAKVPQERERRDKMRRVCHSSPQLRRIRGKIISIIKTVLHKTDR